MRCVSYFASLEVWLDREYKEQILDDAERRYLSAVIRPFRYKVRSVTKGLKINGKEEYIEIDVGGCPMFFPDFKANTMYKGMDLRKEYTLEELGL